ncbi:thioredoxin-disulfide reductase [Acuticoccus sp. MNP-M23]|uniref:thioredoxin-disulfide reductase n=1 Tax=Acuticoccus sp. MNP-M23 TaxID=3072793 RepID=UPI00281659B3|nr:thioredoxin-disulfide reductase [Acuticoccus sp. MNP-M23]WMS43653.1 thioredoxin-disulfide reductase [Acuticoccus sp. MNP-M23]
MGETVRTKLLIIGSGPAGYTAAIYAARAMLKPVLVAGIQPGGQMTITTEVENYPGFADVIQGPWLMEQMRAQAEHVGTEMLYDHLTEADLSQRPFVLKGDSGKTYIADSVILATGAQAKWLGLPSEEQYKGYGVSACATCDGFFYRGKNVAVIGGGNTAVEEALYLTNHAAKVTLIHRRDTLRAERILQERLFAHEKVDVIWNAELAHVEGGGTPPGVTGARIRDLQSGEERSLAVDGIFVAIGHSPATELVEGQLRLRPSGYVWTEADSTQTSVPGVYAAGDVTDDIYRQAVTAAGMGCMAALEAERYLSALETAPQTETVAA